ncbi:MAG: GatB/YqeY domain-containing protein [Candidatus Zhuqueibacterota bacterium]
MIILQKLTEDLKSAMKAKDETRVGTLRLLISDLKKQKIDSGKELAEEQEIAVLLSAAKKRNEAIEIYQSTDRTDLLEKEQRELSIIQQYLPAQMSDQEIENEIDAIIKSLGASGLSDLGKVMGEAMKRLKGKADGKKVQNLVRTKLA